MVTMQLKKSSALDEIVSHFQMFFSVRRCETPVADFLVTLRSSVKVFWTTQMVRSVLSTRSSISIL